jgi:hypothetical protein
MQLVSYNPHNFVLTFILHHPSRARRACCCSTRLASCFFISPEFYPVPPFLSSIYRTLYHALSDTSLHMHLYAYVLPLSSYTLCSVEWFYVDGAGFWISKL